jgi:NADH-quinone oxidoreductase subunit L
LMILGILAFAGGYVQWPTGGFASFLQPGFTYFGVTPVGEVGLNPVISFFSIVFAVGGIGIAWYIWGADPQRAEKLGAQLAPIRDTLLDDYGIDRLYNATFVAAARSLGRLAADVVDPEVFDGIIGGVVGLVRGTSGGVARLETGYLRTYAIAILTGAILIVALMARGGL